MQATRPQWLKKKVCCNSGFNSTKRILEEFNINTVCQSARCPNIFDCFSRRIATFLILGNSCTRDCAFCSVKKSQPEPIEKNEPGKIAEAAFRLGIRYVVITSVTRDDLIDGGSSQFVKTINAIRDRLGKETEIEVLIPDFKGKWLDIKRVVDAKPDIFGHNIETVPGLYKKIRPQADYNRSIEVLKFAKEVNPDLITKSGFMLGLGEAEEETVAVMKDLRRVNCDLLAIGQYLRPSINQVEVKEFIRPDKFLELEKIGYSLGFKDVKSGPFVRSSYREHE